VRAIVRFRSGRASWAAIALFVGLASFETACSAFDCGAAYKAFWQEFRELAAYLPGDRLAALSRRALRTYDACRTGDVHDPNTLFEQLYASAGFPLSQPREWEPVLEPATSAARF
jgi:hypothetical protein